MPRIHQTTSSFRPGSNFGERQDQIGPLEDWVDKHPPGTPMVVRYNPAKHNKMVLVATDMHRAGGPHTANNLRLFGFFAASSVLLLSLARIWRLKSDAGAAIANG